MLKFLKESAKSSPNNIINSQINEIENFSGGTQFNNTKGSDLKNSD